jgi:hypothetical protein
MLSNIRIISINEYMSRQWINEPRRYFDYINIRCRRNYGVITEKKIRIWHFQANFS